MTVGLKYRGVWARQVPLAPQTNAVLRLHNMPGVAAADGQLASDSRCSLPQDDSDASGQHGGGSTYHAMLGGRNGAPAAFPIPHSHRQVGLLEAGFKGCSQR